VSVGAASRPAVAGRATAAARTVGALWGFTRPHTIIGTTLSVVGLYAIATTTLPGLALGDGLGDLWWTLVAAWCVNVYIVGLNQLEDVEIDRVNKPFLPIASGALAAPAARRIVAACALVPIVLALTQGIVELAGVLASPSAPLTRRRRCGSSGSRPRPRSASRACAPWW
jgi:homogentisate phytyltransferase/homogentisate geranylgeranyltransferase